MNHITLPAVLDQLREQGFPVTEPSQLAAPTNADEPASPWYVKLLVGFSAWVAAILLGTFFGMANLIDSGQSSLIWGAILTLSAIGLCWWLGRSIFWGQLAFALSLAGQGLLIAGFAWDSPSTLSVLLFILVLEFVLFLIYPDTLHRFFSLLAIAVALTYLFYDQKIADVVHLLTLLTAFGTLVLWQHTWRVQMSRWSAFHTPLGFGLPISLFGLALLPILNDFTDIYPARWWWLSSIILALACAYLAWRILAELALSPFSRLGLGVLLTLALLLVPAWGTPGILAAVLVLGVAFWRRNALLLGLAILFLLFFLGFYYYNLNLTLLVKSYILMGAGVILLGLYRLLAWQAPGLEAQ